MITEDSSSDDCSPSTNVSERERWNKDIEFKERELTLQETEQALRQHDLLVSGWRSPLVVAVFAAAVAAFGNAAVALINGVQQRDLEREKSEQVRILEMIKTGSPDKAAENLEFLLKGGLISNPTVSEKLRAFLAQRSSGQGPSLAAGGIVGNDDARDVKTLKSDHPLLSAAKSVGRFEVHDAKRMVSACTAFLISTNEILTAGHCVPDGLGLLFEFVPEGGEKKYRVTTPVLRKSVGPPDFAILTVDGLPGKAHGFLKLSSTPPRPATRLGTIIFRGDSRELIVADVDECRVIDVDANILHHGCDTGPGSGGAPILAADGREVVGVHLGREPQGIGFATRADIIAAEWKKLKP